MIQLFGASLPFPKVPPIIQSAQNGLEMNATQNGSTFLMDGHDLRGAHFPGRKQLEELGYNLEEFSKNLETHIIAFVDIRANDNNS